MVSSGLPTIQVFCTRYFKGGSIIIEVEGKRSLPEVRSSGQAVHQEHQYHMFRRRVTRFVRRTRSFSKSGQHLPCCHDLVSDRSVGEVIDQGVEAKGRRVCTVIRGLLRLLR